MPRYKRVSWKSVSFNDMSWTSVSWNGFAFSARWLLVFGIFCGSLYALDPERAIPQYVHRVWQTDEGLRGIRALTQSRDGYILVGGQAGLTRFDGVRFSPVKGDWVRSLLEDERGRLWIGTNESGVIRLDRGASTHFTKANGLPSDHISCLVADRKGEVWACTPEGLVRFSKEAIQVYAAPQGLPVNHLVSACAAPDGTLWFGADSPSLTSWNGSFFQPLALSSLSAKASARAVVCSKDGTVWVGSNEGLIQVRASRQRRWTDKDGLVDNRINALLQSSEGALWIGTQDGLSRLRNGRFENFRSDDGLSQGNISALFEDREGSVWMSTKRGLDQFLDGPAILYTAKDGLPDSNPGPVLPDGNGHLWIGTLGGGLSHFDGHASRNTTQRDGLISDTIHALARDPLGNLWVGTDRGINRLHDAKVEQTFTRRDGLPSDNVRCLFRDRSGAMWAGTGAGPAKFVEGRFEQPRALAKPLYADVAAMGEDLAGHLFFGTRQGGVYSFANGKVEEILHGGAPILDADAFHTDADGLVWIGTIGSGLLLLDHGKVFSFSVRDGLYDKKIFGIAQDSQGRLWFTCVKGLFSVKRADLLRFAAGKTRKFASAPYTPIDASSTIQCRSGAQPAILPTPAGRLWFSADRGLVAYDPARGPRDSSPPPIALEQIVVDGQVRETAELANLPPGEKNLQIRYTGFDFTLPAHLTFRYKLEGYDRKWIDAGTRREAYYTKLPPGKFRFLVTACKAEGICNSGGGAVDFELAYAYYQRAWFVPGCMAIACLAIWLYHRLRVRRLRERFSLVLAERNRIARELHDTLIQGLSGLTMQVQALRDRTRFRPERDALDEIVRDAAACMRETRQTVLGLRSLPEPGPGLAAAVGSAAKQITKETNIRLRLQLEEIVPPLSADIEHNLLCIVREAVLNSVRHSGAGTVGITLVRTGGHLRLAIRDDGRGFDRERGGMRSAGHYGLIGMKERAGLIGAVFQLETWPGYGTAVSVVLDVAGDERVSRWREKQESAP